MRRRISVMLTRSWPSLGKHPAAARSPIERIAWATPRKIIDMLVTSISAPPRNEPVVLPRPNDIIVSSACAVARHCRTAS